MVSLNTLFIIIIFIVLYVGIVLFSYWGLRRMKRDVLEQGREAKRHVYEIAILKEIGDRTGYSLNIQKILDIIMGSLNQFLDYSAVSYMLLGPAKIVFKVDLDESVSPQYIKDIRERMLGSLTALSGRDLSGVEVEETITGAIMLEIATGPVQSYFNIPLVIGTELVGVLTVSNTKGGLYKESEMEILYKIVNQASQAVTKLEEVVKTEQGKIAATLESMLEGVVMTDRDYRVIAANPAIKNIMGFSLGSTPTIFDLMDAFKGVIDIKGKLEEAVMLDKVLTLDEIFFNNKYYQVVVSPVRSNIGAVIATKEGILGGVIIFHDITPEKEAEKMRNDFISMMVHELRSPLGNIKKIGELMRTTKILEDKKTSNEYVSMLYDSSSSMLDLVNDLLDIAKLDAGKFDVDKQPADIKKIITDSIKFFSAAAEEGGVMIKFLDLEKIPFEIMIDTKRITQVINNLLSNAINHTSLGGTVTIDCFTHKKGTNIHDEAREKGFAWVLDAVVPETATVPDSLVVSVTDTGEGIAKENIEKLFNKFTQFSSSVRSPKHKGTGLGLVIVKGIVEAHGGIVMVSSKQGTGSTFYFTIPL